VTALLLRYYSTKDFRWVRSGVSAPAPSVLSARNNFPTNTNGRPTRLAMAERPL